MNWRTAFNVLQMLTDAKFDRLQAETSAKFRKLARSTGQRMRVKKSLEWPKPIGRVMYNGRWYEKRDRYGDR